MSDNIYLCESNSIIKSEWFRTFDYDGIMREYNEMTRENIRLRGAMQLLRIGINQRLEDPKKLLEHNKEIFENMLDIIDRGLRLK